MTDALQLLLNAHDAAQALSMSERNLWAKTMPRGPIPAIKLDGRVLYPVHRLRAWIDAELDEQAGVPGDNETAERGQ